MDEISAQSVKQAVLARLTELFPGVEVYQEEMENKLYPNFSLYQAEIKSKEDNKGHWFLHYAFRVTYLVDPELKSADLEAQLDEMAFHLISEFKAIDWFGKSKKLLEAQTQKEQEKVHYLFKLVLRVQEPKPKAVKQLVLENNIKATRKD